jgi:uncharacterized protein with FMN-binding domain
VNRAPIVLGSTAVGLGLVLSFHTHKAAGVRLKTASPPTTAAGGSSIVAPPSSGTSPAVTSPSGAAGAPATTTPSRTRTATGQDVQYQYGDIQLRVTAQGGHITNIDVVQNGAADPRSAQINSIAVPMLTSQAMSAQSPQIDGVSGASFTSAAYAQALQSALDQLHA